MTKTKITNDMPKGVSAYYEPSTDIVFTSELYSYSWYHEMRHSRQQRFSIVRFFTTTYPAVSYHVGFLWFVTSFFYTQNNLLLWLGILYFPIIFVFGLCEVDAYVGGWIDYKMKKDYEVELV